MRYYEYKLCGHDVELNAINVYKCKVLGIHLMAMNGDSTATHWISSWHLELEIDLLHCAHLHWEDQQHHPE